MASDATEALKRSKLYQELVAENLHAAKKLSVEVLGYDVHTPKLASEKNSRTIIGTNRPNKGKLILVVNK